MRQALAGSRLAFPDQAYQGHQNAFATVMPVEGERGVDSKCGVHSMVMGRSMLVSDFSRTTGLSRDTVRFHARR